MDNADVGLIPFLRDDLLKGVSSIKLYEYCSRGLPIAASFWGEIENMQLSGLHLAKAKEEFELYIIRILELGKSHFEKELISFANKNMWEERIKVILHKVNLN